MPRHRRPHKQPFPARQPYNQRTPLDFALDQLKSYEADSDKQRLQTLVYLEKVLAHWAGQVLSHTKGNPWSRPRVALVTFGSYRLGVHRKASDIDVLAVAPPSFTRDDFFSSLVEILRRDSRVADLHPIPGAYTPVIKFVLMGYQIDMLFARVKDDTRLMEYQSSRISPLVDKTRSPEPRIEYMITDEDLADLDGAGVRSMNGSRVSQLILQMIPHYENFKTALRAIKEWAVQVGVYSNVLGFMGGINWAIMVAFICMRYPDANNMKLVKLFFRTFSGWKWPKPVLLAPPQTVPPPGVPPLQVWDPRVDPRDRLHICPIITPAYPSMNSAYNMGYPQLRRIQDEMIRARNIFSDQNWDLSALFEPSDFFTRHEHFVQVTISATNRRHFLEWFRFVESKLRLLISNMDTEQVHVWPFARFFDKNEGIDNCESYFYMALRFAAGIDTIVVKHLTSDFLHKINSWKGRRVGMDMKLEHLRQAELPDCVTQLASSDASCQSSQSTQPTEALSENLSYKTCDEQNVAPPPPNQALPSDISSPVKRCRIVGGD